ncbi:MAG: hypothetical protein JOZ41_11805, partial [Chloroflexi bacterium]|nr:hypothetical protein [Chloroflexota bacterium]
TRLSPAGDQLLFSTYFGGAGDDAASGVAVDGAGAIYVSGSSCPASSSSRADVPPEQGFPLVHPLQPSAGGQCSAFLTKLTATGTPVFSTFLPGPGVGVFNPMCVWNCPANSVAVDSLGNAVVSGSAGVAKVDAAGARMLYTAPVPGAAAVAMDTGGDAYVVGDLGKGLPRTDPTPDPLTSETGGHFLAKLSPAGALLYTTYLAGGSSIAPAPNGDTYVAGQALRSDLPLVHAIQAFSGDFTYGGAYVAVFSDQPAPPATPVPVPTAPPASPRACGKRPPARSAASLPRTVRLDWPPQAMAVAERDGLVFMAGVQGASGAGAVRVLDVRSGSTLCTIVLPRLRGAGPMPYPPTPQPPARFAIAVDDGARRAFVLDRGDAAGRYESQVAVFDTGSGSLLRALPVGSHAVDLAIAQSAGRVFVLRQRPYARGGVLVLDAARGLPVRDVAAVAVQPLQMVSDERRHRDLVLETCLASGCTILRVLDAYRGHYTGKITAPPDSSDVETMRLVAGTDRLFLIGAGGGCRGGPVSVTTAIDLHTDRVVRSAADVDCDAITVGPVDERAGAVLVVDSAGCCGGTQLPRPHTLVLDGHTGRILRRLSPGLGVPAGIDERTGNVYFSSGDVVEPRGWTVVRRLNLPFQPDLAAVGQRSRRTFLAGRSAAARGPVTGMLSVVCADAGCS